MRYHLPSWIVDRRQLLVAASLVAATCLCAALLVVRAMYAHSLRHFGLAWNLFLAWMPFLLALAAYNLGKTGRRAGWLWVLPCAGLWLVFFPNAPYIITDLLHLSAQDGVPVWYDLILLSAFAWTGAMLGMISLGLMHVLVARVAGNAWSWIFVLGVLMLSGFGVYLGRFPRWNSWDLLASPQGLLADIWQRVRHPFAHPRTVVFSLLFGSLLATVYGMLAACMAFFANATRAPTRPPS